MLQLLSSAQPLTISALSLLYCLTLGQSDRKITAIHH